MYIEKKYYRKDGLLFSALEIGQAGKGFGYYLDGAPAGSNALFVGSSLSGMPEVVRANLAQCVGQEGVIVGVDTTGAYLKPLSDYGCRTYTGGDVSECMSVIDTLVRYLDGVSALADMDDATEYVRSTFQFVLFLVSDYSELLRMARQSEDPSVSERRLREQLALLVERGPLYNIHTLLLVGHPEENVFKRGDDLDRDILSGFEIRAAFGQDKRAYRTALLRHWTEFRDFPSDATCAFRYPGRFAYTLKEPVVGMGEESFAHAVRGCRMNPKEVPELLRPHVREDHWREVPMRLELKIPETFRRTYESFPVKLLPGDPKRREAEQPALV
jgi:hypothetical protein